MPCIVHRPFADREKDPRKDERQSIDEPTLRGGISDAVRVEREGIVHDEHRHRDGLRHGAGEQLDLRIRLECADHARDEDKEQRGTEHGQHDLAESGEGPRPVQRSRLDQILGHVLQSRKNDEHGRSDSAPDVDRHDRAERHARRQKVDIVQPDQAQDIVDDVPVLKDHQLPEERRPHDGDHGGQIDHRAEDLSAEDLRIQQERQKQRQQSAEKYARNRIDERIADRLDKPAVHREHPHEVVQSQKFERLCGERGDLGRSKAHDQAECHRNDGEQHKDDQPRGNEQIKFSCRADGLSRPPLFYHTCPLTWR